MSRNPLGRTLTLAGALLLTICLAPVQARSQNTALIPAPFAEGRHAEFLDGRRCSFWEFSPGGPSQPRRCASP